VLLIGGWEAYGCYQSDIGLATHRAWIWQVFLGGLLIFGTSIVALPALFLSHNRKKIVSIALSLIGIGTTPIIVRLLWGPLCQLLLHRVY
jgi:hypothetical protein